MRRGHPKVRDQGIVPARARYNTVSHRIDYNQVKIHPGDFALLFCVASPPTFAADVEWGEVRPKGELDGIPMHYITIKDVRHDSVQIKIDGKVKEPIWAELPAYDNMLVAVPGTGKPARWPTAIKLFATEKGLYISSVMKQPKETLASRMTNRDEFIDRDTFGVTIDTTGHGIFAYWFTLALAGR